MVAGSAQQSAPSAELGQLMKPCGLMTEHERAYERFGEAVMLELVPPPDPNVTDADVRYDRLLKKYMELIMAVASKYPDETRHQTALRYIREAEETAERAHYYGPGY